MVKLLWWMRHKSFGCPRDLPRHIQRSQLSAMTLDYDKSWRRQGLACREGIRAPLETSFNNITNCSLATPGQGLTATARRSQGSFHRATDSSTAQKKNDGRQARHLADLRRARQKLQPDRHEWSCCFLESWQHDVSGARTGVHDPSSAGVSSLGKASGSRGGAGQ